MAVSDPEAQARAAKPYAALSEGVHFTRDLVNEPANILTTYDFAARLAAMVCPIGLPGISDKAPAVIAVAVAAQLLTVWEAAAAASPGPLDASSESN
jgi:hypothetical protein